MGAVTVLIPALPNGAATFKILEMRSDPATWEREDAHGEFMAIAIHTAYHLGAIRQALAVIRSRR